MTIEEMRRQLDAAAERVRRAADRIDALTERSTESERSAARNELEDALGDAERRKGNLDSAEIAQRARDAFEAPQSSAGGETILEGRFRGRSGLEKRDAERFPLGTMLREYIVSQREQRALYEGSGVGNYIVAEKWLDSVFDRLAAQSVGLQAGFQVVELGESQGDRLHVPQLTADPTAAWTSEGATISPSDPTLNEVIATPHKLAAIIQMSNELYRDAIPASLEIVMRSLTRALALKLDLGFFEGSGTAPEIKGLKNVSGIGTVSLGTNGATPTNLDPFADAIGTLALQNVVATAIVMSPRTWQTLTKIKELSGSAKPVMQDAADAPSPVGSIRPAIYGVPVYFSSQLSVTETQGTSSDASSAYVLQADQVLAVHRMGIEIEQDTSRLFNSDQRELRGITRWDMVVPNPAAVVRIVGIRP